jgi:hypothetical protein
LQLGVVIRIKASEFEPVARRMNCLQMKVEMEEGPRMTLRGFMLMRVQ